MEKNISEISIETLKALGFDCQNAIMVNQRNLEFINQEIQRRSQAPEVKEEQKPVEKKTDKQPTLPLGK